MPPAGQGAKTETIGVVGVSLIAGIDTPADAARTFFAENPATGERLSTTYTAASREDVDAAARAANAALPLVMERSAKERAAYLDAIATKIVSLDNALIALAGHETGLPAARLTSERDRTVNQLRMFAEVVREGSWVRASVDRGDANRRPIAKPELRKMLRPLGPVAVFGASNFPLAYSTAGGDTASALAAGCPVIVKGHPAHPGTGELVARAIAAAAKEVGFPSGVFSFLHAGGSRATEVGQELVTHPMVKAVGFTGSFHGGMALAGLAARREIPIPVFAEMGSVNPVFLLPQALEGSAAAIAERLAASMTSSCGQMCTCPGLFFAVKGRGQEEFSRTLNEAINRTEAQVMLTRGIRDNFDRRVHEVMKAGATAAAGREQAGPEGGPVRRTPILMKCTMATFRANATIREECFGPGAVLVVCDSTNEFEEAASLIPGSLTGSIFAGQMDAGIAKSLQRILEQRVGRLIYNGVPTGVEVNRSMVHGGPYPATNMAHSTAVGLHAMERWCRPVCYQNAPETLLPAELKNSNPLGIEREIDGERGRGVV